MSSTVTNNLGKPDGDEIDLGRLLGEVLDHRKMIVGITGLFTVVAIIYTLFSTPIYQADALIQVEQKQGNALLNSLSQILPDSQPQSAPEIALLQSRMILGKTVDDLNLQAQIEQKYFPVFGRGWARLTGHQPGRVTVGRIYVAAQQGKMPELTLTQENNGNYHLTGGGYNLNGHVGQLIESKGISLLITDIDAKPGTKFSINYINWLDAINKLQSSFKVVDQSDGSGMLNLTLTGSDPVSIEHILLSISDNYLAQNIDLQAAQASKSLDFLTKQLPQVRTQLDNAEDKLSAYRKRSDSVDLNMQARSTLEQVVNVDNQLNQLTFREAEISQLYTKDHPTYKALLEKRKTLEQEKAKLNQQVSGMPATQQEVLRLSRDVDSGRAVYMQLLNRQQELNIAKNSAIGNVRIVDNAITEPNSVKPKKKIIVLAGLIFGFLFSVGFILIRSFLQRGIESPEELEKAGVNVYATIPMSEVNVSSSGKTKSKVRAGGQEKISFLAIDNPSDLSIEAIRSLRTSLHFAMIESKNNVVMISGGSPNVGKTFISTNLAAVIAQMGQRVLFIDADMRKGYAHKIFKSDIECGLSDILSGKLLAEQVIKKVSSAGFDFISRGTTPPNPAELLMNPRFEKLIDWASKNYDLVLIDTPPILAVTDPAIIGRYAGASLLVARFEQSTVKEVEVSIKRFEQSGIEIKGCILNGIVKKASSYYGYGYNHYGYTYDNK